MLSPVRGHSNRACFASGQAHTPKNAVHGSLNRHLIRSRNKCLKKLLASASRATLEDDPNILEDDPNALDEEQEGEEAREVRRERRRIRESGSNGNIRRERRTEKMTLDENDPLFLPALTDEDLAQDPPDHRSGYVAVIGLPNAGKSTLINAIVGQKLSIISFKAQTTRHRIMGIASDKAYQMILFDTPGIIVKHRTKLEERMMSAVVASIQNSEAIVAVVDARNKPKEALSMFQPGPDWSGPPMAVLINKSDLLSAEALEELKEWYAQNCRAEQVFTGSAKENTNIQALKDWAVTKLPLGPTLYPKGVVSDQPEKFFVSEIIREKIFFMYSQEIPYSIQVHITEFKERQRPAKDFVHAQILVERETQKAVVIGHNGNAIKRLGQLARKDIEDFLEREVYLELSVHCQEKWRDSKDALQQFGYFDPQYI